MGHEGEYTKAEILDLSENCHDFDFDSSAWLSSALHSQKVKTEKHTRECNQVQKNNCNNLGVAVSEEELKIRSELGMKIERDLEEEIKEGIYHLAIRLHRIYQQRNERNAKEASEAGNKLNNNRNKALSEVKISIRMEGGSKVEIKEVNKEAGEKGSWNCRSQQVKEVKKVDWVKTLRRGSSPVCVSRPYVNSSKQKDRKLSSDPNVFSNSKSKKGGSSRLVKRNANVDKKILQLGWKV